MRIDRCTLRLPDGAAVRFVRTLRLPDGAAVRFVRTLRLPETGTHPLPPGLGAFPVRRVLDFPDTVPEPWRARGGVMLPVCPREAMRLSSGATPTTRTRRISRRRARWTV